LHWGRDFLIPWTKFRRPAFFRFASHTRDGPINLVERLPPFPPKTLHLLTSLPPPLAIYRELFIGSYFNHTARGIRDKKALLLLPPPKLIGPSAIEKGNVS